MAAQLCDVLGDREIAGKKMVEMIGDINQELIHNWLVAGHIKEPEYIALCAIFRDNLSFKDFANGKGAKGLPEYETRDETPETKVDEPKPQRPVKSDVIIPPREEVLKNRAEKKKQRALHRQNNPDPKPQNQGNKKNIPDEVEDTTGKKHTVPSWAKDSQNKFKSFLHSVGLIDLWKTKPWMKGFEGAASIVTAPPEKDTTLSIPPSIKDTAPHHIPDTRKDAKSNYDAIIAAAKPDKSEEKPAHSQGDEDRNTKRKAAGLTSVPVTKKQEEEEVNVADEFAKMFG